jgi:hypothetical protein
MIDGTLMEKGLEDGSLGHHTRKLQEDEDLIAVQKSFFRCMRYTKPPRVECRPNLWLKPCSCSGSASLKQCMNLHPSSNERHTIQ